MCMLVSTHLHVYVSKHSLKELVTSATSVKLVSTNLCNSDMMYLVNCDWQNKGSATDVTSMYIEDLLCYYMSTQKVSVLV